MLTLLEKLYGSKEAENRRALDEFFTSFFSELDVEVKLIGKNGRGWIQVNVLGSDSKVVINYLAERFGLAPAFTNIHVPIVLNGKVVSSGKVGYGIYIDVGLSTSSPLDILIPLHRLRSHLSDGKKLPLRKIVDMFCLYDNFPLSIRLTRIDLEGKKMWAEPSAAQIQLFRDWLSTYLDRVIVLGAHLNQIMRALKKSGTERDIAKVDELGFFEYSLVCKLGTDAPGIINALGHHLIKVPLYAFSPRQVINVLGELPPI